MGGSESKELLGVEPSELCFPFETNKQISCSTQLTNKTDNYIAFKVQTTRPMKYSVRPNSGILPPRTTRDINVTMQAQSEAPPDMQCNDKFLVVSAAVKEGITIEDLTKEMFQEDATNVGDPVKLRVLLQPPSPSESGSKELLGIKPSELYFPFEIERHIKCSMQLTNRTDDYVAFKIQTTRPKKYRVRPNISIVLPRSFCDVLVTMQAQSEAPPDMQCNDKFLVLSIVVREGTKIEDLTDMMFQEDATNAVDRVKLRVVLQAPSPVREESEEVSSLLPWSDELHVNFQDAGSTLHNMTLQHLKNITNNFSNEGILGRGGFGVVYKGVLGNGKIIAVKKLVQSMSASQEQFENEVNLLLKLKHPNIVQLVGYCYETQHIRNLHEGKPVFAWNTECLLCLEWLPKGSLEKYISDASSGLDWPTRYKIIEGISYGLQYLHEQADGPIIHLDLKPGNILLDEDMIPKVTDFGLSILYDKKQSTHTSITSGTLGYMPPEYIQGIITPMWDIFSLGVIIMEVITGHRDYPYDIRTSSTVFIELEVQKWRNVLQKNLGYTSLETDCQQIKRCIQIGLICVNPERTKRPTMKKIMDMLEGLESMDCGGTSSERAQRLRVTVV